MEVRIWMMRRLISLDERLFFGQQRMSASLKRDQAIALARVSPGKALVKAKEIGEPWYRAQALSHVGRRVEGDALVVFRMAAKAAAECDDDYKRSAVRAWEIAGLAERQLVAEARKALGAAVKAAEGVLPFSSRSEAIFLLFNAAFAIGREEAGWVLEVLELVCPEGEHWRCRRALRDARVMMDGRSRARDFFC
jgi:hypothetical protein